MIKRSDSKNMLDQIQAEIEQTQLKSKLIEVDRTKFFNQAKETKERNLQIINALKEQNYELKMFRDKLIAKKRVSSSVNRMSATVTGSSFSNKDEKYWRRMLDKERYKTRQKQGLLRDLQDKYKQVQEKKFGFVEQSPLMRTIRILENKLDKVMIKYNQVQSIRRTYEKIVKRLNQQRVGYDNQLAAIERSLKGKEHDFEELLLLAHDATHAKALAKAQLKKYQTKNDAIKQLRKNYLSQKTKEIKSRQENMGRIQQGNNVGVGDNRDEEEVNDEKNDTIKEQNIFNKDKLAQFQQSFRKLKDITGVNDANDIIQKFKTQPETNRSLQSLKESYKQKIQELKKKKELLGQKLDRLRYEGGDRTLTRKVVDQTEENAVNTANKHQRIKLKCQRIDKILVNVKAGIEHLANKLQFYKLQGRYNVVIQDNSLAEALGQINDKVRQMFGIVKNDSKYNPSMFKQTAATFQEYLNLSLIDKKPQAIILQRNNRVAKQLQDEGIEDMELDAEAQKKLTQLSSAKADKLKRKQRR